MKSKAKAKKKTTVKKGSKVKKKTINPIVIIVIIALIIGSVVAVKAINSPKKQILATVSSLETSYNNLDIDGMVECFEPSVQRLYSGANSLLGSLVGVDFSTLASIAPFASYLSDDSSGCTLDDFPKIELSNKKVDITGDDTAIVTCVVKFDGEAPEELTINMVKVDDKWYVAAESLLN